MGFIALMFMLLLCGSAFAQSYVETGELEGETLAEETLDYDWFENEVYGMGAMLPSGGTYFTPEDLDIAATDDPMDYLLIWFMEDVSMPFNMLMFGALPMDEDITEEDYGVYFDEFMYNVSLDFPHLQQDVDFVEVHDRVWERFLLADDEGSMMVNYLSYEGSIFYSASFLCGTLVEIPDALNSTMDQLDVMYLEGDVVPAEEDMVYPWYFF
jgi:hypothetical protein